ncbi:GntR family transcriptional regulator [Micromonospora sp. WMMD980]|nr:GntR family transcriptional regulator [Micromonospora sp. WMMD980]MDG4799437.1 GntR family transcriptional regulator [Micromonospora sp. WMMD980]
MPTPRYGQPRYRAIATELSKRLESGAIAPGALFPAESALTAEFRVSRGTIRRAISVLREAGLVETEHGRGTIVRRNPRREGRANDDESDSRQGEVAADPSLAALFQVEVGTALTERETILRKNGRVDSVVRSYRRTSEDRPNLGADVTSRHTLDQASDPRR